VLNPFLSFFSGVGFRPSTPNSALAYSVVDLDCATGQYSFVHEMAHNMGCQHERKNNAASGINWGYRATDYRSIMSYGNNRRVLYFASANNRVKWNGKRVGQTSTDNAGYIATRLQDYANYRESKIAHFGDDSTLSLETTLEGGAIEPREGNMFDIRAKRDMVVTNFGVHAIQATQHVRIAVYRKRTFGPVAYSGSKSPKDESEWEEIGIYAVDTEGTGEFSLLGALGDMKPTPIPAGQTQAFYITYCNHDSNKNNRNTYSMDGSKNIGDVVASDEFADVLMVSSMPCTTVWKQVCDIIRFSQCIVLQLFFL
jgi:hypothetical protein